MLIMIVDDLEPLRKSLKRILGRLTGFGDIEVIEADGGDDAAWQTLTDQNPDLLITDVGMPKGNGLDFIQRLVDGGKSELPIIIHSDPSNNVIVRRINRFVSSLPKCRFLGKPADMDQTLAVIREVLEPPDPS